MKSGTITNISLDKMRKNNNLLIFFLPEVQEKAFFFTM
ncbi:hypothetical protein RU99_GL000343 [Enterococcus casseliflavus]|nr:hypothetical protein RU99_GL000343 [Enterococcus casseliflavus]